MNSASKTETNAVLKSIFPARNFFTQEQQQVL